VQIGADGRERDVDDGDVHADEEEAQAAGGEDDERALGPMFSVGHFVVHLQPL
jgi:hypothetical protein